MGAQQAGVTMWDARGATFAKSWGLIAGRRPYAAKALQEAPFAAGAAAKQNGLEGMRTNPPFVRAASAHADNRCTGSVAFAAVQRIFSKQPLTHCLDFQLIGVRITDK
ncbi:hypothetical protein PHIN109289_12440 [Phaeobacter inhibens]